jgi:hypothetical protein
MEGGMGSKRQKVEHQESKEQIQNGDGKSEGEMGDEGEIKV